MSAEAKARWAAVAGVALFLAFVALGLIRLQLESGAALPNDEQRASLEEKCLQPVEVPANTLVFLAAPPSASSDGAASAPPPPPLKLRALVTAPVKLDATDGDASAQKPLYLRHAQGTAFLEMSAGDAPLHLVRDGTTYLLDTKRQPSARFGPATGTAYRFQADGSTAIAKATDGNRTLPAGSTGIVHVQGAVALMTLQPLSVARTVKPVEATLHPIRVSGQPGLSSVSIEVRQPGLATAADRVSFTACAWAQQQQQQQQPQPQQQPQWHRATVTEHSELSKGGAKVLVSLPRHTFPEGSDWTEPVVVALATSDGRYLAIGGFQAVSRLVAAGVASVLVLVLLVLIAALRALQFDSGRAGGRPWFSGLFTGPDDDASLSLWQMFIWTLVTVWGMFYVFLIAGNLLVLTKEVLGLLGLAGAGSVAARFIAGRGGSTSKRPGSSLPKGNAQPKGNALLQMLSTNNEFDLMKLQLFIFTAIVAVYVVARIADAGAFPELDANTLLLMGVSQGLYVTSKAASSTGLAKAVGLKAELESLAKQQKDLEASKLRTEDDKRVADTPARQQAADKALAELDTQLTVAKNKEAALKLELEQAVKDLGLA